MYEAIIFDFYGTLVDIKTDESAECVWERLALIMSYNGAVVQGTDLKKQYEKTYNKYLARVTDTDYPDTDILDVFFKIYKDLGLKVNSKVLKQTVRAFRALTTEKIRLYDGVIPILKALKEKGVKLYILSNAQRAFLVPECKMLGIYEYFDQIYISSDRGYAKPDPKFFEHILSQESLKANKVMMVGNDYVCDIKGANKLGIDNLYIHTETSNRKVKEEKATYAIMDGDHEKMKKILLDL